MATVRTMMLLYFYLAASWAGNADGFLVEVTFSREMDSQSAAHHTDAAAQCHPVSHWCPPKPHPFSPDHSDQRQKDWQDFLHMLPSVFNTFLEDYRIFRMRFMQWTQLWLLSGKQAHTTLEVHSLRTRQDKELSEAVSPSALITATLPVLFPLGC